MSLPSSDKSLMLGSMGTGEGRQSSNPASVRKEGQVYTCVDIRKSLMQNDQFQSNEVSRLANIPELKTRRQLSDQHRDRSLLIAGNENIIYVDQNHEKLVSLMRPEESVITINLFKTHYEEELKKI